MRDNLYLQLILVFVPFSLISIGGGASIITGMEHQAVIEHQWLDSRAFLDYFAISRAAPGPGTMLATLIGWHAGGWAGAALATIALFLPSSLLCFVVFKFTNAHRGKKWHRIVSDGLGPVGTGLIVAGVFSIFRLSGEVMPVVLAFVAALIMWNFPKVFPLIVIFAGGAVSVAFHFAFG